jgi:hypothetical protein
LQKEYSLDPLHRQGGGFIGLDEDAMTLSAEQIPAGLVSAIVQAFRKAT